MEITRYHLSIDNGDEYVSRSQHGKYVRYDEAMAMVTALTSQLESVVAENAGLKSAAEFATAPDMWIEQADGMLDYRYADWYVDVLKAAMETPATAAFLAEVRASAVENCAEHLLSNDDIGVDSEYPIIRQFASQLRQGGSV